MHLYLDGAFETMKYSDPDEIIDPFGGKVQINTRFSLQSFNLYCKDAKIH